MITPECLKIRLAWCLPRWLVYWCAIRVWAHASTGPFGHEEAPGMTMDTCLQRWQEQS